MSPSPSQRRRRTTNTWAGCGHPFPPGSVWDPEPSRERVGDWSGPDGLCPLVCCQKVRHKAKHKAKRKVGIAIAAMCWAPSAQRRCHPEEALYLSTFSHLLIVNKLLSLSLSLSHTHTHTHSCLTDAGVARSRPASISFIAFALKGNE